MILWIDADACPRAAKELVCKFALKRKLEVVLVAGQPQIKPPFACVRLVVVPSGPDAADDHLVEQASQEKTASMTAGMQLPPGMKLPF